MMPSQDNCQWPLCGEADITEVVGKALNQHLATIHWQSNGQHAMTSHSGGADVYTKVADLSQGYHIYAMEWEA